MKMIPAILGGLAVIAIVVVWLVWRNLGDNRPATGAQWDRLTLQQLRIAGSDVSRPHAVDFFLYLPTRGAAESAAEELRRAGYTAKVETSASPSANTWLCQAVKEMAPSEANLSEARGVFEGLAERFRGNYDGWGAAVVR